ncbi:hypothetical protein B0H13DRAFT_2333245 [Mycena leptocephala]|nr:hypothetical protein B0H13DRAFT_2333245 [Mycena leptocephala]
MSVPNRPIVHSPRSVSASGLTPSTAVSAFASPGATSAFDMSPPPESAAQHGVYLYGVFGAVWGRRELRSRGSPFAWDGHALAREPTRVPSQRRRPARPPHSQLQLQPMSLSVSTSMPVSLEMHAKAPLSHPLPLDLQKRESSGVGKGRKAQKRSFSCEVMWAARRDFAFPFSRRQTVLYWSSMPKVRAAAAAFTYVPSLTAATAFWMTSSFANDA